MAKEPKQPEKKRKPAHEKKDAVAHEAWVQQKRESNARRGKQVWAGPNRGWRREVRSLRQLVEAAIENGTLRY